MFSLFTEDPNLEEAIANAFDDLKSYSAYSPEYKAAAEQLTALCALRRKRIDPNTALTVAGNLVIGLAVIKHEQASVITSKVWSFLTKH